MAIRTSSQSFAVAALVRSAAKLPGGSFSVVMATGIVSIAAVQQGFHRLALALFAINAIAFALLLAGSLLRLAVSPTAMLSELVRDRTGASYLTIVAGTSILGDQIGLLTAARPLATALWVAASVLWAAILYGFWIGLTIRREKPPIAAGLDGTWLLIVVASEALAILGTHVVGMITRSEIVVYLSLCWFLLGGFFYVLIISLIVMRWWFLPMPPEQLTPPYWINMGAVAIVTLAGARLEAIAGMHPLLAGFMPAIRTATVLSWTVATWWVPLLVALMVWRHAIGGIRLFYGLEYWSMVFPLGMYTAATWSFAHQTGVDFLDFIPRIFLWIAFTAWLATFIGMLARGFARLRHRKEKP